MNYQAGLRMNKREESKKKEKLYLLSLFLNAARAAASVFLQWGAWRINWPNNLKDSQHVNPYCPIEYIVYFIDDIVMIEQEKECYQKINYV